MRSRFVIKTTEYDTKAFIKVETVFIWYNFYFCSFINFLFEHLVWVILFARRLSDVNSFPFFDRVNKGILVHLVRMVHR